MAASRASAPGQSPPSLLARVPPVVVDANVLRNDVLRSYRQPTPTILVNAARMGWVRLFCAEHVVDEVRRHGEEWASQAGLPADAVLEVFGAMYLPLLAVVEVDDSIAVTTAERARLDALDHGRPNECDPDDVPTALLAVHLGAVLLSQDKKVLRAVYGHDVDVDAYRGWVGLMSSAGASGLMEECLIIALTLAAVSGELGLTFARFLWKSAPAFVAIGAGALAIAGLDMSPEARTKIRRSVGDALGHVADFAIYYQSEKEIFDAVAAATPPWGELASCNPTDDVLARACIRTIARAPTGARSAASVADKLPSLPGAQSKDPVRRVLRSRYSFRPAGAGHWTVGAVGTSTLRDMIDAGGPTPCGPMQGGDATGRAEPNLAPGRSAADGPAHG